FVVDWPQGAVIRFDGETGLYIEDFITGMQNSEGVTIGPDSLIYICDWQLNRVNRYDQSGNFVDTFISGSGLQQPNSLVFGPPGGVTGIADRTSGVSTAFNLNQNYPNPFNPSTTISFEIPKSAKVSLQIYNTLGQQVTTLLNQNLAAGAYQVEWQAADIPGGIYFYRLTAGDYEASRRLVLLK
ncbi:MAG: T9SS type A sorting domain-containing protein, partial [candidate division Zixibacteria bacterium]|nr:T9SS type A sorting domain-containing protein [candidate division Zixibacteria bacterium]NIX59595.1 T9SS type A sorting domain-containing protein [candidate division Zixibacteria bacterium]